MPQATIEKLNVRKELRAANRNYTIYSLAELPPDSRKRVSKLPISLKILLENLLRHDDGSDLSRGSIDALINWNAKAVPDSEIAFTPARTLLQDFTGVPCVVDLATMRDAVDKLGGDPSRINPLQPVDLVIDHSVVVDNFGSSTAFLMNTKLEYERNRERYQFLRWGATAFKNFRVVPPGTGIVHQVNLEYLASVVHVNETGLAYPDTLVGTDSHTPMVNGLGVLGWGVGGIEAEAAMLGQPIMMLIPQVVGVKLVGKLPAGATATDLVLTVTQILRKKGVVGKFVEYYGEGLSSLSVADRATISNMSPEYGATVGFFPVDAQTLEYLQFTGRDPRRIELVEAYAREQGMFRTNDSADPEFSDLVELDLATVEPSLAGPRRPQDRVPLRESKRSFRQSLVEMIEQGKGKLPGNIVSRWLGEGGSTQTLDQDLRAPEPHPDETGHLYERVNVDHDGTTFTLTHGAVVISAITSCTNTSNPSVLIAAGLLAKKAVEHGLHAKPWVKTSLAPGSKVVRDYLAEAELIGPLEQLGFHIVGYGCTTCIGNSGPLPEHVSNAIAKGDLVAAAVLSGNRNFEGRINPMVRANYLASPPLVVAYAIAGTMNVDLLNEPIGIGSDGKPVMLSQIWPSAEEVSSVMAQAVQSEMFKKEYGSVFEGDEAWKSLTVPTGDRFAWEDTSTYIKRPTFFEDLSGDPAPLTDISGAKVLAMLGHSVTTDHISPAGSIATASPAGKFLTEQGVEPKDYNSYGSRRGNHEVMMRGTFANIRLRNQLAPGTEGGWTVHLPEKELMSIYDASMKYKQEKTPLVILAGQEYGSGSSRDWAAKGPALLGVKAVIAESYERIHRSNLIGMGILPLQYEEGCDRSTHGLTGFETYEIQGIADGMKPGKKLHVRAVGEDGKVTEFNAIARIDTPQEVEYYRHGGILHYVLRQLVSGKKS